MMQIGLMSGVNPYKADVSVMAAPIGGPIPLRSSLTYSSICPLFNQARATHVVLPTQLVLSSNLTETSCRRREVRVECYVGRNV